MRTAKLYDFVAEREHRTKDLAALLETFDPLPCPRCEEVTKPCNHDAAGSTYYECFGDAHGRGVRSVRWRINRDGDMLRGWKGQ